MTKIIICEASYSDFDFAFDPDSVTLYQEEEVRSISYSYSEV